MFAARLVHPRWRRLHRQRNAGKLALDLTLDAIDMKNSVRALICAGAIGVSVTAGADAPDQQTMTRQAKEISKELVSRLGAALKQALADSGPEGAITVCRDTAPMLSGELSRRTGWTVGRVSLKTRNPLIGQPDAWEQAVLRDFDERAVGGTNAAKLVAAEIVSEPDGDYFRFMQALPVKPLCLTCHGTERTIPESVRERLGREYPNDRATGYYAGQIRGAVTIKRKLDGAP